jgi:hypothetical protein
VRAAREPHRGGAVVPRGSTLFRVGGVESVQRTEPARESFLSITHLGGGGVHAARGGCPCVPHRTAGLSVQV